MRDIILVNSLYVGYSVVRLNKERRKIGLHVAASSITPCSNYHATVIDTLIELICNIFDTDFINNEGRFDISRPGVLEFFASLIKLEYSPVS